MLVGPNLVPLIGILPMASALTDKLSRFVKEFVPGPITEANVADMLREVRNGPAGGRRGAPVVRDFIARVKEKALGRTVLGSLSPGQALVGIVNKDSRSPWRGRQRHQSRGPATRCDPDRGFAGAGKTTPRQLAKHLIEKRRRKC